MPTRSVRPTPSLDYSPKLKRIPKGTSLVRIYDGEKGRLLGYGPLSYNPYPVKPDHASRRGRFSSTQRDVFGVMYAAEFNADERVAVMELVDYLQCEPIPDGRALISPDQVEGLEFVYLKTTTAADFVELRTDYQLRSISTTEESIYGTNYQISRAWSRHIHNLSPGVRGVRYRPVRYGDTDAGCALAVYEDRLPPDLFVEERPTVPCLSVEGRRIFLRCAEETGFYPNF